MMRRSVRAKLVSLSLLLILFALELIGAYFVRTLNASLVDGETDSAVRQGQWLASVVAPDLPAARAGTDTAQQNLTTLFGALGQYLNGEVFVLGADGVVVYAPQEPALIGQKRMDSLATQVFVSRRPASAVRQDPITRQPVLEVAVPVLSGRTLEGVVETVQSMQATYDTIRQVTRLFYTGSVIALALTAVLGTIVSGTLTEPIRAVTRQARRMANGDFSQRVPVNADDEFGDLARAINHLADRLQEALAAGERERDRLQAVIRHMGDGVIAYDAQWHPLFCNDAALRFLPGGAAALQVSADKLRLADALAEGSTQGGARARTRAFLRELGDSILHVHMSEMRAEGQVTGYVVVLRDVTEQEKLNRARRDFVANVSHELRTPLTTIRSYADAVREPGIDDEMRLRFLNVIAREADRMVRLTQDLLQLSGLETRPRGARVGPVAVQAWLHRCAERFRVQADRSGVDLRVDAACTDCAVEGDAELLDRLLDNLLSNALKYTTRGGAVQVRAEAEGDSIRVMVEDTGIGIPAEDLPHVFERFYRVDKARSRRMGGSGLGLALVREIAEWHGGDVSIASEPGVGTRVTVVLPRAAEGVRPCASP
ncbi:MAG: HAMP domain-containing protein [Thermoflavifilum sp.]|nr:HAMP domain-containing protein [Thermoflavifilum sp.]MCL6513116.1 cell wall metabolism sensor histidine kinase WalK [Alicyclobacillus sp.]